MYLEYYGLEQAPFSITPDPHYVFLSEHHRDALAHLLYGIQQGGSGGFVQLTGEVGTGKTTLSRLLLNRLPENTHAALVLNPRLDPVELLQTICEELRLPVNKAAAAPPAAPVSGKRKGKTAAALTARAPATPGGKALFDALSAYLLDAYAKGDRVVLIVDEAQNLSTEALEQVRLLTNLETETQKLLQIILIGQPELRETLARPELRQLAQRITARYHLRPLDEAATAAYLRHRLNTAGAKRFPFSQDAVRRLHRRSGGVPRLINVVAERALLGGYAQDLLTIDARTVDRAADEALAPSFAGQRRELAKLCVIGGLAVAATVLAVVVARPSTNEAAPPSAAPRTATPTPPQAAWPMPDADALLQRLRTTPAASTREWTALIAAWQAPAALRKASADACPAVPAPGWRCLRSRAPLEPLLRIDRPVLLRLRAEPQAAWATLLGADARRVRLSLDGAALDVDRVMLAGMWNGEYLAIWPAPDALEARYAANDADAATALRAFQIRAGLRGSGALDADTLFALTAGDPGPRLSARRE
jgi:general secretion pathway protein A